MILVVGLCGKLSPILIYFLFYFSRYKGSEQESLSQVQYVSHMNLERAAQKEGARRKITSTISVHCSSVSANKLNQMWCRSFCSTVHWHPPNRRLNQCCSCWLASYTNIYKHTHPFPKTPPTNSLHQSSICPKAFIYSPHSLPLCIIYIVAIKGSGDDVNVPLNGDIKKVIILEGSLRLSHKWKFSGDIKINE